MKPTRLKVFALVAALILGGLVADASAVPIIFTHSGVGSGTIGAFTFVGNAFTITASGDTTNRVAVAGGFSIDNTFAASITINGVGTFSFITPTRYFVDNLGSSVGFARAAGGANLFVGPMNAAFTTWDMLSPIGPIVGVGTLLQWLLSPVDTSGGVLVFNDGTSEAVFMARLGGTEIPEPGTLVLLGTGLVIVAHSLRRRVRRK